MATKKTTTKKAAEKTEVRVRPLRLSEVAFKVYSLSPYMQHRFSEKAKEIIRLKKEGKSAESKVMARQVSDPYADAVAAAYIDPRTHVCGVPVTQIKQAMESAAHKDTGVPKTAVRKGVFFRHAFRSRCGSPCVPIYDTKGREYVQPDREGNPMVEGHPTFHIREDCVRVGMGSADLRYRPEIEDWMVELHAQINLDLISAQEAVNLLEHGGWGSGIGEWRPEKSGGEYGRFTVKVAK